MEVSYLDLDVGELLDMVARREPAPGGGAVAALAMSLAAGLVAMVARYSQDRLGDGDRLVEAVDQLRVELAPLADRDAAAYGRVIEAYAVARESSVDERAVIRDALRGAAQVPLAVAEAGADLCELAARLAVEAKRDVRGDAVTALLLAEAATRSAAHLVKVNVAAAGEGEDLAQRCVRSVAAAHAAVISAGPIR